MVLPSLLLNINCFVSYYSGDNKCLVCQLDPVGYLWSSCVGSPGIFLIFLEVQNYAFLKLRWNLYTFQMHSHLATQNGSYFLDLSGILAQISVSFTEYLNQIPSFLKLFPQSPANFDETILIHAWILLHQPLKVASQSYQFQFQVCLCRSHG